MYDTKKEKLNFIPLLSVCLHIYTPNQAQQYLLLMWLDLLIMIVVFGLVIAFFLERKDVRK